MKSAWSAMGEVHQLLRAHGKQVALESDLPRDVVEAAAAYMAAEDSPLAVAYSGWAQCALPHRKTPSHELWVVESDRVRLVVEPGHRASGRRGDGPMEAVGVPYG